MDTTLVDSFRIRVDDTVEDLTVKEIRQAIKSGAHVYHCPDFGCPVRIFGISVTCNSLVKVFDKNGLWWEAHRAL